MKKELLFIAVLQIFATAIFAQHKPAYKIFNTKGKKVSYTKMVKKLAVKDFVFFGEIHNNSIAHWLQYEVTIDLLKKRTLMLGAEMFEADNQMELNDYLAGKINYEELDSLARLWSNYNSDYAPLVEVAKENGIPFIATNIPRRYANMVYKKGFEILETLSAKEKKWMAPLPIPFDSQLTSYKNILKLMGDHGSPDLVRAQATKDATMAFFINKNYKEGRLFIHFNGAYHSDIYEGILWYLQKEKDKNSFATISTVEQESVDKLQDDNKHLADFIICVDKDMTKSY